MASHDPANELVRLALDDLAGAETLLERYPDLPDSDDFYVSLVLGNAANVQRQLLLNPDLAKTKGGPRDWAPMLYVCFSRFAKQRDGGHAQTARILLAAGADPDSSYLHENWQQNPLSCLYAATGLQNNPALARVLLEAGANPNDSESVYHSTEHPDRACLKLLLEFHASLKNTNALKHMLDHQDVDGVRLLLAAGADPNETNGRGETALHWAVRRNRSPETIAALLNGGAEHNARRQDGRTAYALAKLWGQSETAALLQARGADTTLSALDAYLASDTPGAPPNVSPADYRLLPELAIANVPMAIKRLLNAGVPVDTRGEHGGSALHWACWHGWPDVAKLLLQHGASRSIRDTQFRATPEGWLEHGRENCCEAAGNYSAVADLFKNPTRLSGPDTPL